MQALLRRLQGRRAWWIIGIVAVVLTLPSLTVGLVSDDWLHALFLAQNEQLPGVTPRFSIFTFASGDVEATHRLMNTGVFPWWTDPQAKLAFFRPVAAATHWLDHRLWPEHPLWMHVHNVVWFALALGAVAVVYRRFLGSSVGMAVAGLAFWFYAVDDGHGPAVGWVANRNVMMSVAIGLPVLVVHDRWRRDGWATGRWLGPVLWAIALGTGEGATGVLGYLIAHAWTFEPGRFAQRMRALWPYGVVLVGYLLLRRGLGFGVDGSDLYLDPLANPWRYTLAALERGPLLLLGQVGFPWSDVTAAVAAWWPDAAVYVVAACVLALAIVLGTMRVVLRTTPVLRFFAAGMMLSLVPVAATFPADRLLWFVGVGAMAWVAGFVVHAVGSANTTFAVRAVAIALAIIHGVASPLFLLSRSRSMEFAGRPLVRASETLPTSSDIVDKTMILINPPADPLAAYLLIQRQATGVPTPTRLRWLAVGSTTVELERLDAYTVRVTQHEGFCPRASERMLRSRARPFQAGDTVRLDEMTVTIETLTAEHWPATVTVRFDRPLEDEHYLWASWKEDGFEPYAVPRVGERDTVPAVDLWRAFE